MRSGPGIPSFAKINLSLELLGRRSDGYTEIRTVYQSVDLSDRIEIGPPAGGAADALEFSCSDPALPQGEDNLVVRAARLLRERSGRTAGASIRLEKRIPAGAGLGGGSGNAAVALLALDRFWGTRMAPEALRELAATLGSDVPFFLTGGTMLGTGRGEVVEPLPDIPAAEVVVALPPFRISTAAAYAEAAALSARKPPAPDGSRLTPREAPRSIWRFSPDGPSINELEQAAAAVAPGSGGPLLARLKSCFAERGAKAAALCGSGSAVFGLFPDEGTGGEAAAGAARGIAAEFPEVTVFRCRTLSAAGYGSQVHQRIAACWGVDKR